MDIHTNLNLELIMSALLLQSAFVNIGRRESTI